MTVLQANHLYNLYKHNGHHNTNELHYTLFAPQTNQQHNFDNITENYYKNPINSVT